MCTNTTQSCCIGFPLREQLLEVETRILWIADDCSPPMFQPVDAERNKARRLTIVLLWWLLLLLPRLLRLRDEVFPLVHGVLPDLLVVGSLECPAVGDAVEDACQKSGVPDDLWVVCRVVVSLRVWREQRREHTFTVEEAMSSSA